MLKFISHRDTRQAIEVFDDSKSRNTVETGASPGQIPTSQVTNPLTRSAGLNSCNSVSIPVAATTWKE